MKGDFQSIGERLDTIESKMDGTVGRVNQNTTPISSLQEQLDQANTKIEDLEKRSWRYNLRIRGLSESVTDLEDAFLFRMQVLIHEISPHHLEIDTVHRVLTAPRPDGLPRDVLVKPHFYRLKEKIMSEARIMGDITLLGHNIPKFTVISQLTIQKR